LGSTYWGESNWRSVMIKSAVCFTADSIRPLGLSVSIQSDGLDVPPVYCLVVPLGIKHKALLFLILRITSPSRGKQLTLCLAPQGVNASLSFRRFIARRDSPDLSQSPSICDRRHWVVSPLVSPRSFYIRPRWLHRLIASARSWRNSPCLTRQPIDHFALDELRGRSPCESLAGCS
jgi:hypothetical protein